MNALPKSWKSFRCSQSLLNLDIVLACGQCFRWSQNEVGEWVGVIGKQIWMLKQENDQIFFKCFRNQKSLDLKGALVETSDQEEQILRDYFQLGVDLGSLYQKWSKNDKVFNRLSSNFGGIRMLRQNPVENLFSFICSQNNHISRISSMVEKLCTFYGEEIDEIDGKMYFSFPDIAALSHDGVEGRLRELGFGYRAKFIQQCAKQILNNGNDSWLFHLRTVPYKEAHSALCLLPGVGAKVADCVCLMSLDKAEAIPVDTHMWQIAQRDYLPHLKKYKSLTDKIYVEIGDHFRSIYGDFAGWAHSVLFSADLKRFRELKEDALKEKSGKKEKVNKKESQTKEAIVLEHVVKEENKTFLEKASKRRSTRAKGTPKSAKQKRR